MKVWIPTVTVAPGVLLAGAVAAPASADATEYTSHRQDHSYWRQHASALANRYGDQTLLKEGRKVCNAVVQGASGGDVADMVQRDLPGATESDGEQIYYAAGAYLCLEF